MRNARVTRPRVAIDIIERIAVGVPKTFSRRAERKASCL